MTRLQVSIGINVVLVTGMILLGLYAFHWRSANAIVTTTEDAKSTINGTVMEYQKHDYRDAVFDLAWGGGLLQTLGNLRSPEILTGSSSNCRMTIPPDPPR